MLSHIHPIQHAQIFFVSEKVFEADLTQDMEKVMIVQRWRLFGYDGAVMDCTSTFEIVLASTLDIQMRIRNIEY